ncbi:ABC transporter permease [Bradyrhizobium sp. NBAIM03]|uniref:ABC transporter permease n=1 Tax=Bradyrhizobium sp. NBAIM03 TaxID=2793816 RepID=UPI001CD4023E|nr:ABC transporter permease [Bradyrhizobium sp. NBAIM03]
MQALTPFHAAPERVHSKRAKAWLLLRGILTRVAILIGASALIFLGTAVIPGDFVTELLGQDYTPELAQRMRADLGLDRGLVERFVLWLCAFLTGDLGRSFTTRTGVWEVVEPRLENTLALAAVTFLWFPVAIAAGLGVFMTGRRTQHFFRLVAQIVICTPEFLIAYIFIYVFAVELRLLPAVSRISQGQPFLDQLRLLVLPSACLGVGMVAYVGRMVLALLATEERKDYFEFARLKGFGRGETALRYALPAITPSILNLALTYCAYLLTGVLVIEVVFGFAGLGDLTVSSVVWRDIPVLQFCAMLITGIYMLLYSLSDLVSGRFVARIAL